MLPPMVEDLLYPPGVDNDDTLRLGVVWEEDTLGDGEGLP